MDLFYDLILQDDTVQREMEKAKGLFDEAHTLAEKILNGEAFSLPGGMLPLLVLKNLTDYKFAFDEKLGIDRAITVATLKDVNLWRKRYLELTGEIGTSEFRWLLYSYTSNLYRIGRLQYERNSKRPWMTEDENVLRVHIPEGEPLIGCEQSMHDAIVFHNRFFPELKPKYFTCESWLLSPNLENVLEEYSNMVKFMRLWTKVLDIKDESAQAIQRTFGFTYTKKSLSAVPQSTSLQKKLKPFLLEGNELNEFAGYIKICNNKPVFN